MRSLLQFSALFTIFVCGVYGGIVQNAFTQKALEEAQKSGNHDAIRAAEKEAKRRTAPGGEVMVIPVFRWLPGLITLIAGEEDEENKMNCWQQILHNSELTQDEIDVYVTTGLPMSVLLQHADGEVQCIFRNKSGERFVIAFTYTKDDKIITLW